MGREACRRGENRRSGRVVSPKTPPFTLYLVHLHLHRAPEHDLLPPEGRTDETGYVISGFFQAAEGRRLITISRGLDDVGFWIWLHWCAHVPLLLLFFPCTGILLLDVTLPNKQSQTATMSDVINDNVPKFITDVAAFLESDGNNERIQRLQKGE